jgi:hypothetical protein
LGATIVAGGRGFQPQRRCITAILPSATKSVSRRRKKQYTTARPRTERVGPATRFSYPQGLIFHFGWERRRIGPLMRGFVPANE